MNFTTHFWDKHPVLITLAFLFSASAIFSSCKKELEPLGIDAIPASDKLEVCYDSLFSVSAKIVPDQDNRGSKSDGFYQSTVCGKVDFPGIATIESSSILSFYYPSKIIDISSFPGDYTFDLVFTVDEIFGIIDNAGTFTAHILSDYPVFDGDKLQADQQLRGDEIFSKKVSFEAGDTITIPFPADLNTLLKDEILRSYKDSIKNVSDFNKRLHESIKGIVLDFDSNTNMAVRLVDVYIGWNYSDGTLKFPAESFEDDEDGIFSPSVSDMTTTFYETMANRFDKEFDSLAYVVSGKCLQSALKIKGLDKMKDSSDYVINYAKLSITAETDPVFAESPGTLSLNLSCPGLNYNATAIDSLGTYEFDITEFIFEYNRNQLYQYEPELRLIAPNNFKSIEKAIFNLNNSRLLISYTKF